MMIWNLSWRNVWRNKRRSAVIITAIALGLFAGIFVLAFTNGMVKQRVEAIIASELSHIQLHQAGFSDNYDFALRMENADELVEKIWDKVPGVAGVSKRIVINSMVASSKTGTGVKIVGVLPGQEQMVGNISDKIVDGDYFVSKKRNPVVIGKKLAEKLKVKVGKKVVITVMDVNKMITYAALKVVGVYETDNANFDEANIYMHYDDLAGITGLSTSSAHEIAVLMDNQDVVAAGKEQIMQMNEGLLVESWLDLSPEASYMVDAMNQYMYVFIGIILLALCFGIINTMLMAVLERMHELGMLMAVGMNRKRVFMMIMLETVFLSLVGGLFGVLLSYGVLYLMADGIDLYFWKEAFSEIGYASYIYPYVEWSSYLIIGIMVMFLGLFSAIYPARKALKLKPVEAIRID